MDSKNFTEIHFTGTSTEQNELLIALLAEIGYSGFEETGNGLKACIAEEGFNADALAPVMKMVPAEHTISVIPQQNWNAEWESSFEPVQVNDFASIRATFHEAPAGVKHDIIITPKMSFGTGHHATTYLMIEQISGMNLQDKTVLDFGTGTGVLAILAEKMGAKKITAIDNDPWSIENAKENALANGCSRINISLADSIPVNETFDVIFANINLNVILANLSAIVGACKPGTLVLLSGFLKSDELELFTAVARQGFTCVTLTQKGDWVCLGITIH